MTMKEFDDFYFEHGTDDWWHDNIVSCVLDEQGNILASMDMDGALYLKEGESEAEDWERLVSQYDHAEVEPLEDGLVNIILCTANAVKEAQ